MNWHFSFDIKLSTVFINTCINSYTKIKMFATIVHNTEKVMNPTRGICYSLYKKSFLLLYQMIWYEMKSIIKYISLLFHMSPLYDQVLLVNDRLLWLSNLIRNDVFLIFGKKKKKTYIYVWEIDLETFGKMLGNTVRISTCNTLVWIFISFYIFLKNIERNVFLF